MIFPIRKKQTKVLNKRHIESTQSNTKLRYTRDCLQVV